MAKIVNTKQKNLGILTSSLVILFVLGSQLYTAKHLRDFWPKFRRLQALHKLLIPPKKPSLWPFIDYPMYSYPKYLGSDIKQYKIYGILSNSTKVRILPEDLGINYWIFLYGLKEALRNEDIQDIKNFIQLYETKNKQKLMGIQLENHPLILTETGVILGTPEIVTNITAKHLEENKNQ